MITELEQLQTFINQTRIPTIKQQIGFLELIKKAHNETINSNIYAHFLSCKFNAIQHAFLDALTSIIKEKTSKDFSFPVLDVTTELPTINGRIDIVIQDLVSLNTILIENKIYHILDNDLKEYWKFFKINEDKKVGVLLTLNPHPIDPDVKGKFINITHWKWISRVKETLNINNVKDEAYKIYVTDFINTIENISKTYTMNASAKFFFEHATKVNKVKDTLTEGHNFLNSQYELIAAKLGLQTHGNDINWRNIWDEDNILDTFLTIDAQDLISGKQPKYKIILELYRDDRQHVPDLTTKFENHPQFKDKSRGKTHGLYIHLLVKEYDIAINDLGRFADIVVNHIKNDFNEIFIEVIEYLYPEKDISSWKPNFLNL